MLYNLIRNKTIGRMIALDANEGIDDLAFENGWRMVLGGIDDRRISKTIHRQDIDEWRRYLANLAGDDWMMVDDPMFTVYYDDNADEFDEDDWDTGLEDPSDDADTCLELGADLGPVDVPCDMVETFHFLNRQ